MELDNEILSMIGLAFISGYCANKANEDDTEETEKEEKVETIEVKKVTPEEMAKIFDELKNKVLGGKK